MKIRTTLPLFGFVLALGLAAATRAEEAKTYKPDDEGFIRNWLVLDPIKVDEKVAAHDEASCKEFLDKQYFKGENEARPKEGDKADIDGKEAAWHAVQAIEFSVDLAKVATDAGKDGENAVFLGVAYVTVEKETPDVKLSIGSDDDSLWSVNGKEAVRVYAGRGVEKDQDKSENLTLKSGLNVITFKVINGNGPSAAAARFVDKDGNPVKDLTVSLTPPAAPAK